MNLRDKTPHQVKSHLLDYFETTKLCTVSKAFTKHLTKKSKDDGKLILKDELDAYPDAWFMEDPFTKGLVRGVEIDIEPEETFTFIIVLKSPVLRKSTLFLTNIVIKSESRVDESLSVFCFGAMEIPKMVCPKEIYN
jgi:hypothetical protein